MSEMALSPGRDAATPIAVPAQGWWQVLKRTYGESTSDNLGLIAAGVAFYGFLAMVPLLGAMVLTYGLAVDPADVSKHMQALTGVVPSEAAKLIDEQLKNVVATATGKKGFGLALALLLAVYGAMKGAGAVVTALNIAYEEEEDRGFLKATLVNAAVTVTAILLAFALMLAASVTALLEDLVRGLGSGAQFSIKIVSWVAVAALASFAIVALYRYAPARSKPQWKWITPGSILATLGLVIGTLGFGYYAANFGNYNATYGSLGAVVVLLLWLYLSAYVLLLGAEFNAELEHQTARDTTVGQEKPLGARGAKMADEVAGDDRQANSPATNAARLQPDAKPNKVLQTVATVTALVALRRVFSRRDKEHRRR